MCGSGSVSESYFSRRGATRDEPRADESRRPTIQIGRLIGHWENCVVVLSLAVLARNRPRTCSDGAFHACVGAHVKVNKFEHKPVWRSIIIIAGGRLGFHIIAA